eukprot:TRINITY_DN550_c0_g1_i1.p1 TRINITY_DN550_c0_g1~~TRINITY_DN550_c0_g1_i1.p1  ORF type:complete len:2249 (-),score=816.43 TRINITY_DN550_c0_g1_i1:196-6942(-)
MEAQRRQWVLALLLCVVACAHAYGTLFADEVQPYKNDATHITAVKSSHYTVQTLSVGHLDAHNRNGFVVNTPGDITGDAAEGLRIAAQFGLSLGDLATTTSVAVQAEQSLTLISERVSVRATELAVVEATSGDVSLSSTTTAVLEGADITVEAGGAFRAIASDGSVEWFGSDGFSMEAESARVLAEHRAAISSDVGDLFVQSVGAFSSRSNVIDVLGRNGIELASSTGGVRFEAFAVMDLNGGRVDVDALDTVRLTSQEQSIVFAAATHVDFSAHGDLIAEVGNSAKFETTGDSESHILFTGSEGVSFVSGGTTTVKTTLPGSSVELRADGQMVIESNNLVINAKDIGASSDGIFNIDAMTTIDMVVTNNNVNLKGSSYVGIFTGEDLLVDALDDIEFIASFMSIEAGTFDSISNTIVRFEADSPTGTFASEISGNMFIQGRNEPGTTATVEGGDFLATTERSTTFVGTNSILFTGGLTEDVLFTATNLTMQHVSLQVESEVVSYVGDRVYFTTDNATFVASDELLVSASRSLNFFANGGRGIALFSGGPLRSSSTDTAQWEAGNDVDILANEFVIRGGDITFADYSTYDMEGKQLTIDSSDFVAFREGSDMRIESLGDMLLQGDDAQITGADGVTFSSDELTWIIEDTTTFNAEEDVSLIDDEFSRPNIMRFESDSSMLMESNGQMFWNVTDGNMFVEGVDDATIRVSQNLTIVGDNFLAQAAASFSHSSSVATMINSTGSQFYNGAELLHDTGGDSTYDVSGGSGVFQVTGGAVLFEGGSLSIDSDQAGVFWLAPTDQANFEVLVNRDLTMTVFRNHSVVGATIDMLSTGAEDVSFTSEGPISVLADTDTEQRLEWRGNDVVLAAAEGVSFNGTRNAFEGAVTEVTSVNTTELNAGVDINVRALSFSSLTRENLTMTASRVWATGSNSVELQAETGDLLIDTTGDFLNPGESIEFTSGGPLSLISNGRFGNTPGTEIQAGEDAVFTAGRSIVMLGTPGVGGALSLELSSPVTNVNDDVLIEAQDGTVIIGGGDFEVLATEPLNGEINIDVTGNVFGESEGGMRMISEGANANGNGIELHTTDQNGDIALEAVLAEMNVRANQSIIVTSGDLNVLRGESVGVSSQFVSISALDRAGDMHGFEGFVFGAEEHVHMVAGDNAVVQARDLLRFEATEDVDVLSLGGHIRIATASAKDVTFTATEGGHRFEGLAFNATAGQSIAFESNFPLESVEVEAIEGMRLTTISGPIEFGTGTPNGGAFTLRAEEEIVFDSGRNLLVDAFSVVSDAESTEIFSGAGDVRVETVGGVAQFKATGAVRITSLGDRTAPRDGISFSSLGDQLFAGSVMDWNAQNLVEIGLFRETQIELNLGGSASQAGLTIDSRGNQYWSSGELFATAENGEVLLEAGDHLALEAVGGLMLVESAGLEDILVDAQLGSVFVLGGNITAEALDLITLTSVKSGIEFEHTGSAGVQGAAGGKVSLIGGTSSGDVGSVEVSSEGDLEWRATTDISFTSTRGSAASVSVFADEITMHSASAFTGRTNGEGADLRIGLDADTVEMRSLGTTGSPITIGATELVQLESLVTDVKMSGKDVVFLTDNVDGDDSRGSLEAAAIGDIFFFSEEDTELTGAKRVGVLSELGTIEMSATRDIAFEAGEDLVMLTSAYASASARLKMEALGSMEVHTNVGQGGDVVFVSADDLLWTSRNWELEAGENVFGAVETVLSVLSDDTVVLNSEGANATTAVESNGDLNVVADFMRWSAGTTPNGNPSSHYMEADHSTVFSGSSSTKLFTDGTFGDIVFEVEQEELGVEVDGLWQVLAGRGVDMQFDGVRTQPDTRGPLLAPQAGAWELTQEEEWDYEYDGYALWMESRDSLIFGAPQGPLDVSAGVGAAVFSELLIALRSNGSVNVQSSAEQGNTNIVLGYNTTTPSTSIFFAQQSVGIDATDEEGGTARLHSSNSIVVKALEEIDFRAQGSLGNIEVIAGVDPSGSGHSANVEMDADLNARFQSARRMSIDATDTDVAADIVFSSELGVIEVSQFGKSENSVGAELRAVHGDILIDARGTGEVVLEAAREINAAADDRVEFLVDGPNGFVDVSAGVLLVGSRGGTASVRASESMQLAAGSDFNVRHRLHGGDVFVDTADALSLESEAGSVLIESQRGDVVVQNSGFGSIQFNTGVVDIDTSSRFTLPTTYRAGSNADGSTAASLECPIPGEVRFFQSHGQSTVDNHGELCHCTSAFEWRCRRFGS